MIFCRFSGGPPCNRLFECTTCRQEQEALYLRMSQELEEFLNLNSVSSARTWIWLKIISFHLQHDDAPSHAIAMSWFRQWQAFMKGKSFDLPGPIDNTTISVDKNGVQTIKPGILIIKIYL